MNSHIKISSVLLYLLPAALVSGPFLSDLILSIIAIIFLYVSYKEKLFNYYKNIFFIIFFTFYTYITIRSFFAEDFLMSFKSSFFYIRFGIFSLAVWYLLNNNPFLLRKFTLCILLTIGIVSIDAYFQIADSIINDRRGQNFLGMISVSATKFSGLFGDELVLGSYLTRLLPLTLGCLLITGKDNLITKIFFFIFYASSVTLAFFSGERTAVFFAILFSIGFIFSLKSWFKFRLITLSVVILVTTLVVFQNETVKSRLIDNTLSQAGLLSSPDPDEQELHKKFQVVIFSPSHTIHYITAYKMFKDNILFGQGIKMYRVLCDEKKYYVNDRSCRTHPHNTYIQFLAETGLVGFIFILLAFVYVFLSIILGRKIFFSSKGDRQLNDYQKCLLFCFFITLWPIIPTGNFFNNWLSIIYYLPVGFYLHSIYKRL